MASNYKQQLLIEYLVSSPDTFALCKRFTTPALFDPEYRKTVTFLHQYYDEYSSLPSADQIKAETGVDLKSHSVTKDQVEYAATEVVNFCKRRSVEQAILAAPKMIAEGNYGLLEQQIKDALLISLNRDLGLSYFENPKERLDRLQKTPQRTSTGWDDVDALIGGGLARRELMLFSANSGGGKSITLANLALNFLEQETFPGSGHKHDVLYLSLELSEDLIAQRFDVMLTGISSVIWQQKAEEIGEKVGQLANGMGRLTIKRLPSGTNANGIRAYLKEFELKHGYAPSLLVVDYLDLMGANESVSADNISEKDKRASEQLGDILFDYNMFGATASQQNRSAVDATELNHSHIAGGMTKINAADWYLSIVMTPAMKAAGEIMFVFLKTRSSDGVGKSAVLRWVNSHLRITNRKQNDIQHDSIVRKVAGESKRTVLDIFNTD